MGTKLGMAVSMLTSVVVAMMTMIVNRYRILLSFRKDLLGSCSKHNKHIYNCTCIDYGDDDDGDVEKVVVLFRYLDGSSECLIWRGSWQHHLAWPIEGHGSTGSTGQRRRLYHGKNTTRDEANSVKSFPSPFGHFWRAQPSVTLKIKDGDTELTP